MAPKRNEFYYFILTNKESIQKHLGKKNMKFADMFTDAKIYKMFKSLSGEEKLKYTMMKNTDNNSFEKKDSRGIPLSLIEQEKQKKIEKHENMIKHIQLKVSGLHEMNRLHRETFFIMTASYYVLTNHKQYVPAEISIVRWTLKDGIVAEYSNIIKDEIPQGERWEAEQYSSQTHCLLNKKYPGVIDYEQAAHDIKKFIKVDGVPQPVYTTEDYVVDCEGILNAIDDLLETSINVYSLDQLLQEFYLVLDSPPANTNQCHVKSVLNGCKLDYHVGIPCEAHKTIYDCGMKYCTLSMCRRWFFLMCSDLKLEENFNITPQPMKHMAPTVESVGAVTNIPKEISVSGACSSVYAYSELDDGESSQYSFDCYPYDTLNTTSLDEFPSLSSSFNFQRMKEETRRIGVAAGGPTMKGVGRGVTFQRKN